MNNLFETITQNALYVLEFAVVILALFAASYITEKLIKKKTGSTERILATRKIAMIGMFSAIAAVLMFFEFPLPFAPSFYEVDLSELPILVGSFAFGPVAGVMMEFVKIVLKLLLKGTSTAFVGDLANFVIGCSFVVPASIVYHTKKTRKMAIAGLVSGTAVMTVFGSMFNAIYLLPAFSKLYGLPLDTLVGMGTAVNPAIDSISMLVLLAVAPLNLLKGVLISGLTMVLYKRVSQVLHNAAQDGLTLTVVLLLWCPEMSLI